MIGVIADDITGAAELGAAGLRHGLPAEILVGGAQSAVTKLVCIDTDSRSCAAGEAAARAAAAAERLRQSGATLIYKKVDSVLRGQVRAELEGIMKQLGLKLALLMPANPSLGRVIRGGRYFVRGRLLHETEFAFDPEYPRRSSDVMELLGSSASAPCCVRGWNEILPRNGIVAGEIGSPEDLCRWAEAAVHPKGARPEAVLAGGVEFFAALLGELGFSSRSESKREHEKSEAERELFVCGSTSESSRQFVAEARERGTPIYSLPESIAAGGEFEPGMVDKIAGGAIAAFRSERRVILNVGLPTVRERGLAKLLAVHLARVAEGVLRSVKVGDVYAEGGATALELVRRMGWSRLTVTRELAPGVATLRAAGPSEPRLTIKPGTYYWPEELRGSI